MSWQLFDRIRAFARSAGVYQQERLFQDQSALDRVVASGEFLDFSQQQALLDQTNLQINRLERYKDYDQMDEVGEISLALDLYCLHGETRIPLLDGTCPTIKELTESGMKEFWMYGWDFDNQKPKPVLGRNPHISGNNAKLVRVSWNGGHIDCTPDHEFYTKRGWVAASELIPGDSLMPINIIRGCVPPPGADHRVAQSIRKGYEALQVGSEWVATHKWVYETFNGKLATGHVIHHKDIRRFNNCPDNLESMVWDLHRLLHTKTGRLPEDAEIKRRDSVSRAIKQKWRDPEYIKMMRPHLRRRGLDLCASGKAWRGGSKPTSDWNEVCAAAKSLGDSLTDRKLSLACGIGISTLQRMLKRNNTTWKEFKTKYSTKPHGYHNYGNGIAVKIRNFAKRVIADGGNIYEWESIRKTTKGMPSIDCVNKYYGSITKLASEVGYNHQVVNVVELSDIATNVYDLYVSDGNAFAAGTDKSWVIVSNSDESCLSDPEYKHTIIIKAATKTIKNALEELFFDQLLIDNYIRPMVRYLCKYGDAPFEIIPTANRDGVSALKFMNIYNFTRVETKFGDLVGFFYQDEMQQEPTFLHPWQVMHLRLTSYENIYHPYGRGILEGGRKAFKQLRLLEDAAIIYRICLRGDSRVWTPSGYKYIKDLQINDEVYCYTPEGTPKLTKVIKYYCNGNDKILRVASRHREIFCNPSHPVLVEFENEGCTVQAYVDAKNLVPRKHRFILPRIEENKEYIKLQKLEVPQYVRINNPIGKAIYSDSYVGVKLGLKESTVRSFLNGTHDLIRGRAECLLEFIGVDTEQENKPYSVIDGWCYSSQTGTAKPYSIPDMADEDFARWFGFMVGDGYVSQRDNGYGSVVNEIGFAKGSSEETNIKYKKLFEKYVGEVSDDLGDHKRLGKYSVYSVHLAEFLKKNGFIPGAHNKRIPTWVYQSPLSVREAFIDGYIDADGNRRVCNGGITEGINIECCNKELVEDFKELIHQIGWNVGIIRHREREGGHVVDEETGRTMKDTESWCLYFTKIQSGKSENILSITDIGNDEVYDITVEDDLHNIIVNGVPVSQTRAPEKRIFTIPVGNIPTKEVPQYIQAIARTFKKNRFYDPRTGTFNERFSPLIQEDDFFLPTRPDGTGPKIDKFPGAENLDQIADIEYFKKKMIAPMKIPFARVGIGDGAGDNNEKSLSSSHSEFAKAVQWVQREVAVGLSKVAICHLAMKGFTVEQIKGFHVSMSATSAIEELYRMETWGSRAGVMGDLKDLGWFPKVWIVSRFTDLSPDEIQELDEMQSKISEEMASGEGGGLGLGGLGGGGGEEAGGLPGLGGAGGAGGEEAGGLPELGGGAAGGEGGLPPLESRNLYSKGLENRVINEMAMTKRKHTIQKYLKSLNKGDIIRGTYSHLIESNELVGLGKGSSNSKVIVESTLRPEEINEIKEEYRKVLVGDAAPITQASVITEADIPSSKA